MIPEAEIAIDEARAAAWIGAAFPELRGASARAFGSGFDNAAFLIDERWVFRLPRHARAARFLAREIEVVPALVAGAPFATSAPTWSAPGAPGFPYPIAGYARLPGTPASQRPAGPGLPEALARALRWLHDRDLDAPGAPAVEGLGKHEPEVARRLLERSLERLDRPRDPIRRAADALDGPAGSGAPRWVHGDLYPRHLLLDDAGRLDGIIDWGDVHRGEIALDLSLAYGWLDPADRARFFAVYGAVADPDVVRRARFLALYYGVQLSALGHEPGLRDLGPVGARYLDHVLAG